MNTYTVRPGDTLSGIYGPNWKQASGYSGDPTKLAIGTVLPAPASRIQSQQFPNTSTNQGPRYSANNYTAPRMTPAMPQVTPTQPKPQSWLADQTQKITNAVVPQAFAAEPPQRKTYNVDAHPDAISTPGFVTGTPDWVKPIIQKAAEKHNIPPMLLSALLKQESGFNPQAGSQAGAQGIAQFMPATAKGMGVDPYDPESAIDGAAQYLRRSWDKFGKPELALAAYNAGGAAVNQYGGIPPYAETQNYVKNIMSMAGEPHQSANGPLLETIQEAKKSAPQAINAPKTHKQIPMIIHDPGTDYFREMIQNMQNMNRRPVAPIPQNQVVPNTPNSFWDMFQQTPPKQVVAPIPQNQRVKPKKSDLENLQYALTHLF
jgi:hypothetical protein